MFFVSSWKKSPLAQVAMRVSMVTTILPRNNWFEGSLNPKLDSGMAKSGYNQEIILYSPIKEFANE
jgi:hypothetical protein